MTKVIRIDTEGEVTRLSGPDIIAAANEEFAAISIVACTIAPILEPHNDKLPFVMAIDDFGGEDMPINYKAWALYGRSPIYGTAFFAYDGERVDRPHLPDSLIATIEGPIEEWVNEAVISFMKIPQDRPEMLVSRAEGEAEPE